MKCSKCGAELNGKFCTNCGAPAPANPVCANCGTELTGKFCTKCGMPAPQEEPVPNGGSSAENNPSADPQPYEPNDFSSSPEETQNSSGGTAQPMDYQNPYNGQDEPAQYNTQPAQPENPQPQGEIPQPVNYGADPNNSTSYGQQFTNPPSNGYSPQQFTNRNAAPANGKKPMSGGKIAIIIVSIVLGLIIILGVIVGVVACNIVRSVSGDAGEIISNGLDQLSSEISNYEDSYGDDYWDYSDSNDESYDDTDDNEEYFDEPSNLYYAESEKYDGWKITGYDFYLDDAAKITVDVPSHIDGREVVEIEQIHVYDNDSTENGYIKIIIPGTVKVIDGYSMSFCEDINELVIEDGVTTIEANALIGCTDLNKVTVPASVTEMTDCGIGICKDDDFNDIPVSNFTLYGKKGSTAEKYAKENGFNFSAQ